VVDTNTNAPFLVAAKLSPSADFATWWDEAGYTLYLPHGEASHREPLRYLIRFPQEGQSVEAVQGMLPHPDVLAMKRGNSGSSGGRLGVSLGTIQARMASS